MKQIKFYSFASALMLASAVGLGSCSSDSDAVENGGGIAGQTVKTQFAINIPYAKESNNAKATTRMTEDITQANGTYRGIENMRLFTFTSEPSSDNTTIGSKILLGSDANAFNTNDSKNVKLYKDISIPVGTTNFALYARAAYQPIAGDGEVTTFFKNGTLTPSTSYTDNNNTNQGEITFSLKDIAPNATFAENTEAKAIVDALNTVAETKFTDAYGNEIYWDEYAADNGQASGKTGVEAIAKNLYTRFTSLRAGSAKSVKSALEGLMTQAEAGIGDSSTPQESENDDKAVLKAIFSNCKEALKTLENNNFPNDLNLPDGVAKIKFNSSSEASGFEIDDADATFGTGNSIKYKQIAYPADLVYFVKTQAMVSNSTFDKVTDFPEADKWTKGDADAWSSYTNFKEGAVEVSTRTIGLKDPLQYGVANLKLSIKSNDNLEDNGKAMGSLTSNQRVKVTSDGFPVTGILIGGQPAMVNWEFEPTADETFGSTIYDKIMNTGSSTSLYAKVNPTTTEYNYTLVLDNKSTKTEQNKVYITIELTNNSGIAFYGTDGLVPVGGTFYLVGTLDPTSEGIDKAEGVDHVFVKDHTTVANLTITSLKSAYNCIPDLRSSLISIGLAVNLEWQKGLKFDVNIGD